LFSFIFIICCCSSLFAQDHIVRGRVLDAVTREPLAFVSVIANNGPDGTTSDIDGKFILHSRMSITSLKLTYIGYIPKTIEPDPSRQEQLILLQKTEIALSEVEIKPGINPAHRIIRKVLENRLVNDHERMKAFSYTTYEKISFGPEHDTVPWDDTMFPDSTYVKMKKFYDRQHLFLMESVTERKFMYPDRNYNNVIASRVSGFGDPLFVFIMSQLQSTSFYKEVIKIADREYINPISNGTFSKYYFEISDTLIDPFPYDTTYIISFRPLLNTNFDGLKGVISISTNSFAIRNVIAEPARNKGPMTIKIQQLYDFVNNDHWFPIQLNTDLIFPRAIGKGNIELSAGEGSIDTTRRDLVGRGKSYITNIDLDPPLKRTQFGFVEVDIQPDAYRKPEQLWNQYRIDSLNQLDLNTYRILDSLGRVNKFDKMGYKFDALLNGKIPVGPFDLELDKFGRVNHHEGFRLGLGAHTNDKLSRYFQLGGYFAYGFKDRKLKFGGTESIIVNRFHETGMKIRFSDDVDEAGANDPFAVNQNMLDPSSYRQLQVRTMDHTIMQGISISSRVFKFAKVEASLERFYTEPLYAYRYLVHQSGDLQVYATDFRFTEASVLIRYAYGEKFLKNTRSIISLGTTYPILWFYAGHGLSGFSGGQYEFNRFMVKVQKTFSFKYLGKTSITFISGMVDRDLPYCKLFNALSDYSPFSFYSPNSFASMRMNEFVSDRYVNFFFSHNFGSLLYRSKHFNPQPELLTNIGFGSLEHPSNHMDINAKSYEKGYYESGLVINNLLNFGITRFGIGSFYRYGYYKYSGWKDNIVLKLAVNFIIQN
jgi:hypothetical protein